MQKEEWATVDVHAESEVSFFAQIKEELDDYREAINQNTDELGVCYDYVQQLDRKLDRLAERIDELALHIAPQLAARKQHVPKLSEKEKWVFMGLYVLVEEKNWVSYKDLGRRLGVRDTQAAGMISHLMRKNVPIKRKFVDGRSFISLDQSFREVQAKKNVLKVNSPLTCWI